MSEDKEEVTHKLIREIKPFVGRSSSINFNKRSVYSACLRASFSKCFEFVEYCYFDLKEYHAGFSNSTLRSICEEIIFLAFAKDISKADRDKLFTNISTLRTIDSIEKQAAFFSKFRPYQKVINRIPSTKKKREMEGEIRNIWKRNGWPKLHATIPPTREVASRVGPGALDLLYDYIFRLTSSSVHFSPNILLRSGWGELQGKVSFSQKNMSTYYTMYSRIYSLLLFTLYFEIFGRFLKPGDENKKIVENMRSELVNMTRWPEMITFEEMNLDVPKLNVFDPVFRMWSAEHHKRGFLSITNSK